MIQNNFTSNDMTCGVCSKPFLFHVDKFGAAACYDWCIQCDICEKQVHSDCSGVPPEMRKAADNVTVWICRKCGNEKEDKDIVKKVQKARQKMADEERKAVNKKRQEKRANLAAFQAAVN